MKNLKAQKRGQIWSIDLAIALILFVGVIFLFYHYSISFAREDPLIAGMVKEGGYVSNSLLGSGYPQNWPALGINSTVSIGLVDDGLLNITKVNTLKEWTYSSDYNYSLSKIKLNTKYNYYIQFYGGSLGLPQGVEPLPEYVGRAYTPDTKQIIKIQRLVVVNDTTSGYKIRPIKLNLYLWTDEKA
jgi:hypothetical protein